LNGAWQIIPLFAAPKITYLSAIMDFIVFLFYCFTD